MKYRKNVVLFTLFAMNLVDQPTREVEIEQGILSGKISTDGSYFEYLGIPYATTNSSWRFKAPLPPPSWKGVYKAVDEIYHCPQKGIMGIYGTEDCLKVNVYVPATIHKLLPVMVFIHGGGFAIGSGGKMIYGPKFLVNRDVVLVTFNYRLGVLGFLCLGTKEAPGNAAIKDQIAALRWVKKNIRAFGGDSDNITVFGHSAGAASTSLLLASNITERLFHKAIIQSGTSTSSWGINRQPLWVASLLTKDLGYNTQDPHEIYGILSQMPLSQLINTKPHKPLGMYFDTQMLNYPCVEQIIPGEEAVLTDFPFNILKNNPKKDVPVIYGTVINDGYFLIPDDTKEALAARDARYIFASDLEFKSEVEAANVSIKLKEFYFGQKKISFEVHNTIAELNTQLYFEAPAILESEALLSSERANVYNYVFNYSGDRNLFSYILGILGYKSEGGAIHGDELLYLFNGYILPFSITKKSQVMIELMTKMWTNFAKYGDPTPQDDLLLKWEPSTKQTIKVLYIEDESTMGTIPNPKAHSLWKDVYTKYRKKNKPNDLKR